MSETLLQSVVPVLVSENATEPVGVSTPEELTVAVNVTDAPTTKGSAEELTVVVVLLVQPAGG